MKKLLFVSLVMLALQLSLHTKAQVNIRKTSASTEVKENTTSPNLQVIPAAQSTQTVQSAQYASTAAKIKYYSVDATSFSTSWGVDEIRKVQKDGAFIYSTSSYGTPYLVAPVNLPHSVNLTSMKVIFYDASPSQDLNAILWQGGPNFGDMDSYNLGQLTSSYSSGLITQSKTLTGKVDNENHSYYVAVSTADYKQWPTNGELKIKRVTIGYTETE